MLNIHKIVPRRSVSVDGNLREATASHRCSFKLYLTWKHHEPKNEHLEAFCFHLTPSSVRLQTRFFFSFSEFPLSQSALPAAFHVSQLNSFVSKGWNSKHLQCSVKKLLYIYLFYSCLVFYSSPLYIKTNKLFLEMSSFSLGAAIFWTNLLGLARKSIK